MSVGKPVPRLDGRGKVTGAAVYVDDIQIDGMLHAWTVRSTVAKGRLTGVRLDPTFDWAGVTVVTAKDIDRLGGENVVHLMVDDQPCLVFDRIEHKGEPVALVACADRERAAEAARHVIVDEVAEVPVLDMATSTRPAKVLTMADGDLEAAFARADHIISAEYRTGAQEQLYIEMQGMVAIPRDDGGITIKGSLQCPYYVHRAIKRLLALTDAQVAIIQTVTGGGFGGKEEYPSLVAGHAALLARVSGKPVKLVYERDEDLRVTTKRHPSRVTHKTGVMNDGTLVACEVDVLFDAGAYVTLSPVVISRGILHAAGPYRFDAVKVDGRAMLTNSTPAGAFRGFGAPQVTYAYERHMDKIAETLGICPVELRRKNTLKLGDRTPTGQTLQESVAGVEVLERAITRSRYFDRRRQGTEIKDAPGGARRRRGVGLSYFFHGAGFTGNGEAYLKGKVGMDLLPDGRIQIRTASTDIGQGTVTIFPQIAAEVLGITVNDVVMITPDTSKVPDSGPTVASRTTMVVGKVVAEAAAEIRATVGPGTLKDVGNAYLAANDSLSIESTFKSPPKLEWDDETYVGDAYPCFGWAADIVEVEVDLDTAEVWVTDFVTVHDAGTIIHPILAQGQVEGGSLQALAFANMEQVVWKDGEMINDRLTNYIIPTSLDAPEMDVELYECPYNYGPFGAKGIGEIPMDGGAPAVIAAIQHALGGADLPCEIPLTPELLLPALAEVA